MPRCRSRASKNQGDKGTAEVEEIRSTSGIWKRTLQHPDADNVVKSQSGCIANSQVSHSKKGRQAAGPSNPEASSRSYPDIADRKTREHETSSEAVKAIVESDFIHPKSKCRKQSGSNSNSTTLFPTSGLTNEEKVELIRNSTKRPSSHLKNALLHSDAVAGKQSRRSKRNDLLDIIPKEARPQTGRGSRKRQTKFQTERVNTTCSHHNRKCISMVAANCTSEHQRKSMQFAIPAKMENSRTGNKRNSSLASSVEQDVEVSLGGKQRKCRNEEMADTPKPKIELRSKHCGKSPAENQRNFSLSACSSASAVSADPNSVQRDQRRTKKAPRKCAVTTRCKTKAHGAVSMNRSVGEQHPPEDHTADVNKIDKQLDKGERKGNNEQEQDVLEIPGMYYDREKKKYFRILPSNRTGHSGAVTRESVKQKEAEEKRMSDLFNFHIRQAIFSSTLNMSSVCSAHGCLTDRSANILHLIDGRKYGNVNSIDAEYKFLRTMVRGLKSKTNTKVSPRSSEHLAFAQLEHMQRMLMSPSGRYLACHWSLKSTMTGRLQRMMVTSGNDTSVEGGAAGFSVTALGPAILSANYKVSGMDWVRTQPDDISDRFIMLTQTKILGNGPTLAKIYNWEAESTQMNTSTENPQRQSPGNYQLCEERYALGEQAAWTCAWNVHAYKFSVGMERCSLLLDAPTRSLWEFYSNNSHVYAQVFSSQTGSMLYSGTKKGAIYGHDLRSRSTHPVLSLRHQISICHLYHTRDDNYLIAADFDGKIKKWDLRRNRVVLEYAGHNNQYSRIPFHVDAREDFLYSAGQDCYTRFWDLRSGDLLTSIPPPHPASRDSIPAVVYSDELKVQRGRSFPGMLMGILDEVHLYGS